MTLSSECDDRDRKKPNREIDRKISEYSKKNSIKGAIKKKRELESNKTKRGTEGNKRHALHRYLGDLAAEA